MSDRSTIVQQHYTQTNLAERLLAALKQAGKDPNAFTREDLAGIEEFHLRGRDATRDLARLAEWQAGTHVLDIGCGIGGPARTLAAEFGCRVTGIDLTEEFVRTARELTTRLKLDSNISFRQGDALNLPFDAADFDGAIIEHVNMNIEDKPRLFKQIARVLRPGGRLALCEICAGPQGGVHYPVPWAPDASVSFLVRPDELQLAVESAGLRMLQWQDVTSSSQQWFEARLAAMKATAPGQLPPLGINLVMGADAAAKAQNALRNLQEHRIEVVQGVFVRSE